MTTEHVTNQGFLQAVFPSAGGDSFGWATSFRGDPKTASNLDWKGNPFRINAPVTLDEGGNTFFNLSTVKEAGGKVGRKDVNFSALHVVVLDDVGTKATLPNGVEPSYLVGPANFSFA